MNTAGKAIIILLIIASLVIAEFIIDYRMNFGDVVLGCITIFHSYTSNYRNPMVIIFYFIIVYFTFAIVTSTKNIEIFVNRILLVLIYIVIGLLFIYPLRF